MNAAGKPSVKTSGIAIACLVARALSFSPQELGGEVWTVITPRSGVCLVDFETLVGFGKGRERGLRVIVGFCGWNWQVDNGWWW
jgi:hypothetical protein